MNISVEIKWLSIKKLFKCPSCWTIADLKNTYAWNLKLVDPEIRFYADSHYFSEIKIKDKQLYQVSSGNNNLRLWALIEFPKRCRIEISIKTNYGAAFKEHINPAITLASLEKLGAIFRKAKNCKNGKASKEGKIFEKIEKVSINRNPMHLVYDPKLLPKLIWFYIGLWRCQTKFCQFCWLCPFFAFSK
ncbi:unnamed protein product [Blepharisma stoltei]|uniref:LAGLIDADG homing endonuclease n=1 Tax=Blepharisma stoltei TaxID=1481888 RepID=A0AAU9JRB6_9CILI|nr:unnamed protein product [Blepharisma stoltei]